MQTTTANSQSKCKECVKDCVDVVKNTRGQRGLGHLDCYGNRLIMQGMQASFELTHSLSCWRSGGSPPSCLFIALPDISSGYRRLQETSLRTTTTFLQIPILKSRSHEVYHDPARHKPLPPSSSFLYAVFEIIPLMPPNHKAASTVLYMQVFVW